MRTLLVIPARNEAENIRGVIERIAELQPDLPVLVVNDFSSDATSQIASAYRNVSVIDLPFWSGYGGALQAAYKYALRQEYDFVLQMDGDGQHDPLSIDDLLANQGKADVVVGSRFLRRDNRYKMSYTRRFGCHLLSWTAKILTGLKITDPTSGFQLLNGRALEIAAQDHYPLDYPDIDVLILLHRHRLKVIEVPVIMHAAGDKTNMHEGFAVWYYGLKMFLSVFIMMLRKA